jgi:protein-S-isoprenylcysteine O-methyltransferase Ste14
MLPATVFHWFIASWIVVAIVVFFVLLRISAPYGRTARSGWGPLVNSRIGWIVMESAAVFSFLAIFLIFCGKCNAVSLLFLFLWQFHYINRAYVFPLRMKSNRKRMALSVVMMALLFNVVNGWINGAYLFSFGRAYPMNWLMDIRCISGIVIFFFGWVVNVISDNLLLRQRKRGGGEYVIPKGFLFHHISCPNYFGEVLEWLGWALLTWSLAGLSFFVWTCANLIPRALTYHRWYRAQFPEYPRERKAIFPFAL